jgi:soluble lytic murein transglycosylase-like protein
MQTAIVWMIFKYSIAAGLDPYLAISIAKMESTFNHKAVGRVGEIGVFQIRPEFVEETSKQLFDPKTNIKRGIKLLKYAQRRCKYKKNKQFVICYNRGISGGNRIKNPHKVKYYLKLLKTYAQVKKETGKHLQKYNNISRKIAFVGRR